MSMKVPRKIKEYESVLVVIKERNWGHCVLMFTLKGQ